MLAAALQFDRLGGASPAMLQISKRAKEALTRIGKESDINARRVKKLGINIETESTDEAAPAMAPIVRD